MRRQALLVLQGGGALGAYQCGAYKAIAPWLRKAGIPLAAIAGASIGALNGAFITRHLADEDGGAEALESLWLDELACQPLAASFPFQSWYQRRWSGLLTMLLLGNPALSIPNYPAWTPWGEAIRTRFALHDDGPMENLIARHVGNYGPNPGDYPLLLVRAIDASTQEAVVFHSWEQTMEPRHVRASCSIPFLYPVAELDGKSYWDGDLWPRTPLQDLLDVLRSRPTDGEEIGEYRAIVVDTLCAEKRQPLSALDLSYQVQAGVLGTRSDADERYADLNNRYVDFLLECAASSGSPGSALDRRVAEEYAAAREAGLSRLNLVRIQRRGLPYEYVSRDLDYSLERVECLIEQGYADAQEVLSRT